MKINIRKCLKQYFNSTITGKRATYELQLLNNRSAVAVHVWLTKEEFKNFMRGDIEFTMDSKPYIFTEQMEKDLI